MQLPAISCDRGKLFNFGKIGMLKLIQNFFLLEIQIQKKVPSEMMREMEKLFESLKDDFNEKLSNFSYFTSFNAPIEDHVVYAGGSCSDSYEDISIVGDDVQEETMKSKILLFVDNDTESLSIPGCNSNTTNEHFPIEKSKSNDLIIHNSFVPVGHEVENFSMKSESNNIYDNNNNNYNSQLPSDVDSDVDTCHPFDAGLRNPSKEKYSENYFQHKLENVESFEIEYKTAKESVTFINALHNAAVEIRKIVVPPDMHFMNFKENNYNLNDDQINIADVANEYEVIDDNKVNGQICVENERKDSEEKFQFNSNHNDVENINGKDPIEIALIPDQNLNEKNEKIIFKEKEPLNEIYNNNSQRNENVIQPIPQTLPVHFKRNSLNSENQPQVNHRENMKVRKISSLNYPRNQRMWSEMPEVQESGILKTLSKKHIQLQEAMFEILTSESSYYQSLMILTDHFFSAELFSISDDKESIVSPLDKHHIFSNVILIMKTSINLLVDLEQRWHEEKPVLSDICDIVLNHVISEDFQSYVTYLRNQQYQTQALKRLSENESFKQQLSKLESASECGKLSLDSYLMLPMQRLTRLKLLVEAVSKFQNSEGLTNEISESIKNNAFFALENIKKLLNTSNTEKGLMDQKSALISLNNRIFFPPGVKSITFSDRTLLREEELRVHPYTGLKTIKKISKKKQPLINLVLFNDLLIITKKKSGRLHVLDYSSKSNVTVESSSFKRNISSTEISRNSSSTDVNIESQSPVRIIGSTLIRSKTSLTGDERKRLSVPLNNAYTSMPQINKTEVHEFKYQTFTMKLLKSDVFPDPLYLTTRSKEDRGLWLSFFNKDNLEDQIDSPFKNFSRLQKSTSLKIKPNLSEIPRPILKVQSFQTTEDGITDEILAHSEIAQDWSDEFLMVRSIEMGYVLSLRERHIF